MWIFVAVYVVIVEAIILWIGGFAVETFHTTNYMRVHVHALGWPPALILLTYICRKKWPKQSDENDPDDMASKHQ